MLSQCQTYFCVGKPRHAQTNPIENNQWEKGSAFSSPAYGIQLLGAIGEIGLISLDYADILQC